MAGAKKPMVCIDCHMRIEAEIKQAQAHGWVVWVGGARCKSCAEHAAVVAEIQQPPASSTALICRRCGHTERWHRTGRCRGYVDAVVDRLDCDCPGFLTPIAEVTP